MLLSGETPDIQRLRPEIIYNSIIENERHQKLTLCIEIAVILGVAAILLIKRKDTFESDTIQLTENINTPVALGQGQHGTARWLNKLEYARSFAAYRLNPEKDEIFADLINSGEKDIKEVRRIIESSKIKSEANIVKNIKKARKIKRKEKRKSDKQEKWRKKFAVFRNVQQHLDKLYKKFKRAEKISGGLIVAYENRGKTEQIYYLSNDVHSLTIGTTRSGKSRCIVLQSIAFTALSGESMVISDPKGELSAYCSLYLEKLGYEVIRLDFKIIQ